MFDTTWYSDSAKRMVTHHKPNYEIYPIVAELSEERITFSVKTKINIRTLNF